MLTLQYILDDSHCFKIYVVNRVIQILKKNHLLRTGIAMKVLKIQLIFAQEVFQLRLNM